MQNPVKYIFYTLPIWVIELKPIWLMNSTRVHIHNIAFIYSTINVEQGRVHF